jgi:hypothetical protein
MWGAEGQNGGVWNGGVWNGGVFERPLFLIPPLLTPLFLPRRYSPFSCIPNIAGARRARMVARAMSVAAYGTARKS